MRDLIFKENQGGSYVHQRNKPGYCCEQKEEISTVDDRTTREISGVEFSPLTSLLHKVSKNKQYFNSWRMGKIISGRGNCKNKQK